MKLVTFKSLTSLKYVGMGEEPMCCPGNCLSDCSAAIVQFSRLGILGAIKKKRKKEETDTLKETSVKIFVFQTDRNPLGKAD